jgi:hypothetical protein
MFQVAVESAQAWLDIADGNSGDAVYRVGTMRLLHAWFSFGARMGLSQASDDYAELM